ncbi:MAG: serine/threonine-protein phosphatase, partial [Chloroflexi bacterium]|nr:serine/threonine-protein phosphatase [Chloroflexota bacterium]
EVTGNISFLFSRKKPSVTEAQTDFANKLAFSVSLAIENARLYATERTIADTLQKALLMIPEHLPGVRFGYLYRSATAGTRVGGDFYDLFELEHDLVGVIIGDVSGKGLEAANLGSLTKNTVKAYANEGDSPARALAKTNRLLVKTSPPTMFVTVFFALLNTTTGDLIYCSGGHPPGMILRGDAKVEVLPIGSPVIGAFEDLKFADNKTRLEAREFLFLYTDGTTEARHGKEFFGDDRIVSVLEAARETEAPPSAVPKRVFEAIMSFTENKLWDDIAMLALGLETRADNRRAGANPRG